MKRGLVRLMGSTQGNVTPIIAILLPVIVGGFAVASETSTWFLVQRSMQHAADSAALAAATNNSGPSTSPPPTYSEEAKGVASRYGYTTGVDNATVTPTYPVACPAPSGATNCYQVVISKVIPIRLARLVGYSGDASGGAAKTIVSTSVARPSGKGTYCITTLSTAQNALDFNGGPKINLTGCDIASAGGASCNAATGSTIGHAYVTDKGKANDDCAGTAANEILTAAPTDIYSGLASNIPTNPCSSYIGTNNVSGVISSSQHYCGTVKLTANTTINSDVTMTIFNGNLDLDGNTLSTSGSGHLTIIFSGTNGAYSHTFAGGGLLNFAAPTSGAWSGVAIYQDPRVTTGTFDISDAGNTPGYKVTGLLYMPYGDLVIKGAINHKTGGDNCVAIVAKTVTIKGGGTFVAQPSSQCDRANLVLQGPPGSGAGPMLVQ